MKKMVRHWLAAAVTIGVVLVGSQRCPMWSRAMLCTVKALERVDSGDGRRAVVLTAACGRPRDYKLVFVGTTQREPSVWAFEEAVADLNGDGVLRAHWRTNTDLRVSCERCSDDHLRIHRWRVEDVTVHRASSLP